MKKLPIGIQTFKKLRDEGCVYVDKTDIAYDLIEAGSYCFLSRPRRFGKSLFIDTISEIFKGNKELFKGLAIYDKWDWSKTNPVIKIDFGKGEYRTEEATLLTLKSKLYDYAEEYGVTLAETSLVSLMFANLIREVSKVTSSGVVILIDEYDKAIIDNITNKEQAKNNQDILGGFYAAIKSSDQYLRFEWVANMETPTNYYYVRFIIQPTLANLGIKVLSKINLIYRIGWHWGVATLP